MNFEPNFRVGDRVWYVRGARASVFGKSGVVLRVYVVHGGVMLDVDFGTEVYPCYWPNVDLEETGFTEAELVTDPG
jgi:hypothetical protein